MPGSASASARAARAAWNRLHYKADRDPATRMLNPRGIAEYSRALADRLVPLFDQGEVPVVLGGDCSLRAPHPGVPTRGHVSSLALAKSSDPWKAGIGQQAGRSN
jgi:arginase family enzyme